MLVDLFARGFRGDAFTEWEIIRGTGEEGKRGTGVKGKDEYGQKT
jgi:hypothetical protein